MTNGAKPSKPRLALFAQGVLGGGPIGQGIPALTTLFSKLSRDYEIIFYSFQSVKKKSIPPSIKTKQIISDVLPGRLNYLLLSLRFFMDHIFNPYDLIVAVSVFPAGKWGTRLGKLIRRPVVIHMIDHEVIRLPDIGYAHSTATWFIQLTNKVCKNAASLIALSEFHKENILRNINCSPEISVLPLRIDTDNFSYRERHISFPVEFIHTGYYSALKDQDTLFTAFAEVAHKVDCRLTVIGGGFDTDAVRTLLKQLRIDHKVDFTGAIENNKVRFYLDKAHILIHAARFEAEPIVIQEAMASGVLVCGTRVGTLADIGDRFAVIVPPRSPGQMAESILNVVNHPDLYRRITDEAYRWISTHDSTWSYRNYNSFFKRIIDSVKQ